MKPNLKKQYYKNLVLSMTLYRRHGKDNIAKPILLLAIIDGISNGYLIGNHITFTDELVAKYNSLFHSFSSDPITPCIYPFYYLNNDNFYYIKGPTTRKTPSAKFLRENVEYAALDDELWDLLQDADTREEFKQSIIAHFLK